MIMKINKYNITKYLLFFLLLVYASQGTFFSIGTLITKTVIFVIILIGLVYFFKIRLLPIKVPIPALWWFVVTNVVYSIFTYLFGLMDLVDFMTLKNILYNLLLFYVAYILSIKNKIREKELIVFYLSFLFISICNFFMGSKYQPSGYIIGEITLNAGYSLVNILPFIFLFNRKLYSNLFLFISLAFIYLSAKRGAIFAGTIFLLFYLYHTYLSFRKLKFSNLLGGLIILLIISFIIYRIYNSSEYLQRRVLATLEGDSSGRDEIYSNIWYSWLNSKNIINILFGYGFNGSLKLTGGMFAHNDWLELLAGFGLLGVFIFITLFIQIYKYSTKEYLSFRDRNIILSILLILFFRSLVSMTYTSPDTVYIFILLGYILGNNTKIYMESGMLDDSGAKGIL